MTTKKKWYGLKDLEKRLGRMSMGSVLNSWRLCDEMTLKEFGALIGVSVANLCDIEKGRKGVSPEKAEKIALALGMPPVFLVKLSIADSLHAAGLKYTIDVRPAA